MRIVNFDQSSESWLEWRRGGIGASDIGVIMGVDPYKSAKRLLKEKQGEGSSSRSNGAMRHGKTTEPRARLEFNIENDCLAVPLCVEDDQTSWMRASLDGWDAEREILVEIKCPVSPDKIVAILETHELPLNWMYQIQWQLGIVRPSSEKAWFALWDFRDQTLHGWEIDMSQEILDELTGKAGEFWEEVCGMGYAGSTP